MAVTVLVSDYTRKIAHELDDLHRAWIMHSKRDELVVLHESPFANGNLPMKHLDWLMEYDQAEDRHQKIIERRLFLQHELGNMRRSRKIGGAFQNKNQFLTHYEALKLELLYCEVLQLRLRDLAYARRVRPGETNLTNREKYALLKENLPDNQALKLLIELRESLMNWLTEIGNPKIPSELAVALGQTRGYLQSEADAAANALHVDDLPQGIDDIFVRKSQQTDQRIKGDSLNRKAGQS